jgi:SAM-dependent methyltransferase
MKHKWEERFSTDEFVYGIEPNEFFKLEIDNLKPGRLLLPGEGEGRNAVYAAKCGWNVDAFDWSENAKEKALQLAASQNVHINYSVVDIAHLPAETAVYDAAALIFIHLDDNDWQQLIEKIIASLKPGGRLILELFEKEQINKNSGGPKETDLLYSLEQAVSDFISLDFEHLSKEIIKLDEGKLHQGEASVVRFVGVKV